MGLCLIEQYNISITQSIYCDFLKHSFNIANYYRSSKLEGKIAQFGHAEFEMIEEHLISVQ